MNRIIGVNLADYWDFDEERVTVTTEAGTEVLYDLHTDIDENDEIDAAEYIDTALAEGQWLLRFAGSPGDFLVGASTASDWATYRALTDIGAKFTLTAVEEVAR